LKIVYLVKKKIKKTRLGGVNSARSNQLFVPLNVNENDQVPSNITFLSLPFTIAKIIKLDALVQRTRINNGDIWLWWYSHY